MKEGNTDRFAFGGQAVIEGVMMRGRHEMAVAARATSGEIVVWSGPIPASRLTARLRPWPVVRGIFLLWDAITLGVRALAFSGTVSERAGSDDDRDESPPRHRAASTRRYRIPIPVAVAVAILFSVGLFFVLPLTVVACLNPIIASSFVGNVIEGLIRLGLLIGYVWGIGFLPDIRRVFGYHGAEHKAVHAWEAGTRLAVTQVRQFPLEHPRCGTGFMLVVVVLSSVLFMALGDMDVPMRVASRVVLVPLVAGVAYEVLKYGGRPTAHPLALLLLAPSRKLQRLTTREPDDSMLEVAIAALLRVLVAEGQVADGDPRLGTAARVDFAARPFAPVHQGAFEPFAAD